MENGQESSLKERHGCVSAWLIFMIVVNAGVGIYYLVSSEDISRMLPSRPEPSLLMITGVVAFANVAFAVLLLKWKKMGFFGFIGTSVAGAILNIVMGLGIGQSLTGLIGVVILYGILQIKKNDKSAWENLE